MVGQVKLADLCRSSKITSNRIKISKVVTTQLNSITLSNQYARRPKPTTYLCGLTRNVLHPCFHNSNIGKKANSLNKHRSNFEKNNTQLLEEASAVVSVKKSQRRFKKSTDAVPDKDLSLNKNSKKLLKKSVNKEVKNVPKKVVEKGVKKVVKKGLSRKDNLSFDDNLELALDQGSASCRNGQVIRIYRVLTLLETSRFGLSVKDLTEIISSRGTPVHERTIYRDLDVLRASGFPLEEKKIDKKSSSKWRIIKQSAKNSVQLSPKEIFSLYLAQSYLKPLEQTPFYSPISSVFDKLTQNLSAEASKALASMGDELNFETGSLHGLGIDEQSFQTTRLAIGERQLMVFDYLSSNGKKTKRKCGPQFLYFAKGGVYLIAKDFKDNIFKTFALPRIKNAEMLDLVYGEPALDPKAYFQNCFGVYKASEPEKILLKFSPEISGFVKERRWHDSQINRTLSSGELEVELFVGVTPELTQWVLGFGSHVYVSHPISLRKMMAEEISRMQKIY